MIVGASVSLIATVFPLLLSSPNILHLKMWGEMQGERKMSYNEVVEYSGTHLPQEAQLCLGISESV